MKHAELRGHEIFWRGSRETFVYRTSADARLLLAELKRGASIHPLFAEHNAQMIADLENAIKEQEETYVV